MALRDQLPEDRRADVDKELEEPKSRSATAAPRSPASAPRTGGHTGGDDAFKIANEIPVRDVLTRFNLLDGDRPTCPGCREADSGVAIVGNGLKCSHNRCSGKGYRNGFRTVVDLVSEVEGLEAGAALRWLREHFPEAGIPEARAAEAAQVRDEAREPEPFLPLETPRDLPPFPVHALPPEVGAFVAQLTAEMECPVDLPAVLALGALGSVSMKRYEVCPRGNWSEPLNLYLAIALEPGESKSPVFRRVFSPIYKLQKQLGQDWEAERKRIDARNKQLSKGEPEEPVPPRPRLFVDDATPEKIGMILAEQGERITLASDEGTAFQHMCGLYSKNGQPNAGVYLKAHDGGHYVVDRMGRDSIHLEAPLMTVALAVQPTVIRELAKRPDLRGRGLWGRFAYAFPASRVGSRTHEGQPMDPQVQDVWHELLHRVASPAVPLPETPAQLRFSQEARERFHQAELEIERAMAPGAPFSSMRDWAGKLRGLIARIAGLLHVVTEAAPEREPIRAATLENALAIGRYFTAQALYTFNVEMTLDPTEQAARQVWEVIQRKGLDKVTPGAIGKWVKALRKTADATAALEVLCRQGCLETDHQHKGKGRSFRVRRGSTGIPTDTDRYRPNTDPIPTGVYPKKHEENDKTDPSLHARTHAQGEVPSHPAADPCEAAPVGMVGMVGILKNTEKEPPPGSVSRSVLRSVLSATPPPVSGVKASADAPEAPLDVAAGAEDEGWEALE